MNYMLKKITNSHIKAKIGKSFSHLNAQWTNREWFWGVVCHWRQLVGCHGHPKRVLKSHHQSSFRASGSGRGRGVNGGKGKVRVLHGNQLLLLLGAAARLEETWVNHHLTKTPFVYYPTAYLLPFPVRTVQEGKDRRSGAPLFGLNVWAVIWLVAGGLGWRHAWGRAVGIRVLSFEFVKPLQFVFLLPITVLHLLGFG